MNTKHSNPNNLTTLLDNIFESICTTNESGTDVAVLTKSEFEETVNRIVQWDRKRIIDIMARKIIDETKK